MISAEIIIDKRKPTKKGYPLRIRIYDSLEVLSSPHRHISLKIYQPGPEIKLDSFLKKRLLDLDNEVEYCNKNHLRLNDASKVISEGIPIDDIDNEIELLEIKLSQLKKKSVNYNKKKFIEFTKELIVERIKLKKDPKSYKALCSVLLLNISPKEDFYINEINREFLRSLEIRMLERGNKSKTISTYFTNMKTIYNEALQRKFVSAGGLSPFYKINITDKKSIEYSVNQDDFSKLLNISPDELSIKNISKRTTQDDFKRDIDIFLFQIAIGGHDYIDIANLKWKDIRNGRIRFIRTKNRSKNNPQLVDNLLSPFALKVLEKYGNRSSERIFSFIPDPNLDYEIYHNYLVRLNKSRFKRLTNDLKLNDILKTKAPRYIFRTLAGNLLIDSYIIMKLQGHKPQGMTFGYQGTINYEVQDREHNKILDLVFK